MQHVESFVTNHLPVGGWTGHFRYERFNFCLKLVVLCYLTFKESASQQGLLSNTLWREHIYVAKLVLALAEVLNLDPTFVDKRFQAVVQTAGADAQFFSNLALRHVGVVLQHAQDSEVGVFLELGTAGGHVKGFWPRYRHAVSRSASALGAVPQGNVCTNLNDFRVFLMSFGC